MGDNFHTCIFSVYCFLFFSSLIYKQQQSLREHVYEINCHFACFKNDIFLVIYLLLLFCFLFLFNFCNCGLLHRNSTVARRVTNVSSEHYGNP